MMHKKAFLLETSPLGSHLIDFENFNHDRPKSSLRLKFSKSSQSTTANAGSLDSSEILESPSLRGEAEAIYNTETSDFDKNRNKNNLHEVQQPQEASSEERVRVVREGEENDFAFVRSTNPHLQIQVSSPSLKIKSIENPCEKDSSKSGNLESSEILSLSLRESGMNEAISNHSKPSNSHCECSEAIQKVDCHDSVFAESHNDKLVDSNRFPRSLATSRNDKQRLDSHNDKLVDSHNKEQNLDSHSDKNIDYLKDSTHDKILNLIHNSITNKSLAHISHKILAFLKLTQKFHTQRICYDK